MTDLDLAALARRTRQVREAGIALLIATGVLSLFLFIPFNDHKPSAEEKPAPQMPAFAAAPLTAEAAIVYDLATGETLFVKNADAQLPLASLTKLLTVYAALRVLPPSAPITVSAANAGMEAPHAFHAGDTFALADLARLTLTGSLNDGAAAIAEAAAEAGHSPASATLASAAAALSLSQTYALNGSGLDENAVISGGYGSARDMARLAGALATVAPDIASATTRGAATASSEKNRAYAIRNTDPVAAMIPGLLLSKTGFTDLAGGNLALVFDAGIRHPIAVVVLGSTKDARFADGMALVNATLAYFAHETP